MQIYLPIAEMSVNLFTLFALGGLTGVLSGMLGVGGGFLLTPLLIFLGIPPAVAVASTTNQIVGQSFSGFMAHWRRRSVDVKMGVFILIGSITGSSISVLLFRLLRELGQIDLVISLSYVFFLGLVGILMGKESIGKVMGKKKKHVSVIDKHQNLTERLPFKIHFPHSELHISALLPITLGFSIGLVVTFMGTGGGFMLIPAMLYILGMPTTVVIGTSLFHAIFITANVTILQAYTNQTVDIFLALSLLAASTVGAQMGTRMGSKLPTEYLRAILALIVLAVAIRLGYGLFITPNNIYSVDVVL